jgi:hypothetical protein
LLEDIDLFEEIGAHCILLAGLLELVLSRSEYIYLFVLLLGV